MRPRWQRLTGTVLGLGLALAAVIAPAVYAARIADDTCPPGVPHRWCATP